MKKVKIKESMLPMLTDELKDKLNTEVDEFTDRAQALHWVRQNFEQGDNVRKELMRTISPCPF